VLAEGQAALVAGSLVPVVLAVAFLAQVVAPEAQVVDPEAQVVDPEAQAALPVASLAQELEAAVVAQVAAPLARLVVAVRERNHGSQSARSGQNLNYAKRPR
jgi:hypothetical protein